jgi:hypothetical protein
MCLLPLLFSKQCSEKREKEELQYKNHIKSTRYLINRIGTTTVTKSWDSRVISSNSKEIAFRALIDQYRTRLHYFIEIV